MKHSHFFLMAPVTLVLLTAVSHAAITYSGGIGDAVNIPSDPNTWTNATEGFIGLGTYGEISVSPTSTLLSDKAYIGYTMGVTGAVTIDGTGSAWITTSGLSVGEYGTGTLDLLNGGALTAGDSVLVGNQTGSNGTMIVDASALTIDGGKLTAGDYGIGTLEIRNGATVSSSQGRVAYHDGSNGTAIVSDSTWTNTGDFIVGAVGTCTGILTIENGGQVSNAAGMIAYDPSTTGTVNVTGSGSQWNCSDFLHVGRKGSGTLNITNGGVVNTTTAHIGRYDGGTHGSVLVSGTGSQLNSSGVLAVGQSGTATGDMRIENGAVVTSAGGRIGYYDTTHGSVVVDGGTWNNTADLFVIGTYANTVGSLEIINGGQVHNSAQGTVGHTENANGTVSVSGTGSLWSNNTLYVGRDATGTLNISNGGTVTANGEMHIGNYENGSGTITVTGSGSTLSNSNRLMVGNAGTGMLNINDGATVTVRNTHINDGQSATSSGTINFDNGTLNAGTLFADFDDLAGTGTVNTNGMVANVAITFDSTNGLAATFSGVGSNGNVTINFDASSEVPYSMGAGYNGAGSLTLTDGIVFTSTNGHLAYHSTATATATVSGEGTAWMMEGNLYVGRNGAATLEITDGGLVSMDGTLTIDDDIKQGVSDAIADSFINMSDGGMLAVYAGLAEGEVFDPANLGTLVGGSGIEHIQWWNESISDWASITTATLDTDYTLDYITEDELAGFVLLTVGGEITPEDIPGDANHDGKVDGSDVTILAGNWQVLSGATWSMGDFNGDKKVDGSDVTILAGNWQYGVSTTAASVPEPGMFLLLLGAIAALFAGHRVRRN